MRAGEARRIALALAALIAASSAAAAFEDDYAAGLKALDQGRLNEARDHLQRAQAAHPEPADQVSIGGNQQPYLPLHFLGIAAFREGDCAAAASYWNSAANRRQLGRLNMIRQQEQNALGSCKQTEGAPATPAAAVETKPPAQTEPAKPATTKPDAAAAPAREATAKPAAPEALVLALQNYLAGRYAAATRIEPTNFGEARARFHAFVVRAAARFMLANTGGDAAMLDAARADVRAARALDPRTQPDAATFAPRFRTFYAQPQ